ncbi:hypothetical protein NQZ79_g4791 [Umbelopsis isabellina]|nr:hypothetical protein NQZ79_g4791 [Umbelopsis isabellina]
MSKRHAERKVVQANKALPNLAFNLSTELLFVKCPIQQSGSPLVQIRVDSCPVLLDFWLWQDTFVDMVKVPSPTSSDPE